MKYADVTSEMRERLRLLSERRLTAEEFEAYVSAPMSDAERDEILSLVRWFRRRYPTAAERLAYNRRAAGRSSARQRRAGDAGGETEK